MSEEQQQEQPLPLARYAQVVNGVVVMVIEAAEDPDGTNGQWIACGDAGPGWLHDGEVFTPPAAPTPRRWITCLAFDNRFTQAESVAIEIAQLDDPSASMPARQAAAALRASQRKVDRATYIDLDRPDTRAGVLALEAGGLLGAGRALEILDAPIQLHEVYQ